MVSLTLLSLIGMAMLFQPRIAFGAECDLAIGLSPASNTSKVYESVPDYDAQKAKCVEMFNATLLGLLSRPAKNETPIVGDAVQRALNKGLFDMMGKCKGTSMTNVRSFSTETGYTNQTFYVNQITIQEILLKGNIESVTSTTIDDCPQQLKSLRERIEDLKNFEKSITSLTDEEVDRLLAELAAKNLSEPSDGRKANASGARANILEMMSQCKQDQSNLKEQLEATKRDLEIARNETKTLRDELDRIISSGYRMNSDDQINPDDAEKANQDELSECKQAQSDLQDQLLSALEGLQSYDQNNTDGNSSEPSLKTQLAKCLNKNYDLVNLCNANQSALEEKLTNLAGQLTRVRQDLMGNQSQCNNSSSTEDCMKNLAELQKLLGSINATLSKNIEDCKDKLNSSTMATAAEALARKADKEECNRTQNHLLDMVTDLMDLADSVRKKYEDLWNQTLSRNQTDQYPLVVSLRSPVPVNNSRAYLADLEKNKDKLVQEALASFDFYALKGFARGDVIYKNGSWVGAHVQWSKKDQPFLSDGLPYVTSLSTVDLMADDERVSDATRWVVSNFSDLLIKDGVYNVKKTITAYLGGLLSIFTTTAKVDFLGKAIELSRKLLPAYQTISGLPYAWYDTRNKSSLWSADDNSEFSSPFASLNIEWDYLSEMTGNPVYRNLNQRVLDFITKSNLRPRGMFRNYLALDFYNSTFWPELIIEAGGNYLDYLVKTWIRGQRTDDKLRQKIIDVSGQIRNDLIRTNGMWTYVTVIINGTRENKMAHSTCYVGGLYALAGAALGEPHKSMFISLGEAITATCYEFYKRSPNNLPPTLFEFLGPGPLDARPSNLTDQGYHLTSSTVESILILWRLTHNEKYRKWGQAIGLSISKLPAAQSNEGSAEVAKKGVVTADGKMHADYFMAETLKYLFLLFTEDKYYDLDTVVFNSNGQLIPSTNYMFYGGLSKKKDELTTSK